MARCRFGWTKGSCTIPSTLGMAGNKSLALILDPLCFHLTRTWEWRLQTWQWKQKLRKTTLAKRNLSKPGGLHILALMQKPRVVRTHCIASFLSVCSWFVIFPNCCCIKALTVERAWHDMSETRLCSGMRLWSWRFFSCVQCTKVQPRYKLAEGKNPSAEFCLVSEELVQVSSKGCVCSFLLLMQF